MGLIWGLRITYRQRDMPSVDINLKPETVEFALGVEKLMIKMAALLNAPDFKLLNRFMTASVKVYNSRLSQWTD